MDEKISRRKWIGSVAKASAAAVTVSSLAESKSLLSPQAASADKPFDMHQHVAAPITEGWEESGSVSALIAKDYEARVRSMDLNKIGQSVIMAGTLRYRKAEGIQNTRKLNDMIAEYVAKHSDRFPVGIGTVEPSHGDASLKELDRMAQELKLRGVVWHNAFSGVAIDDPFMRVLVKHMAPLGLIPFVHVARKPLESMWMLADLADDIPDVTFVALAGLATIDDHGEAIHVAKAHKNILFDTGPVIWMREPGLEKLVKRMGADRILFGSDLYALTPSYRRATTTMDIIQNAEISAEERAKIFSGNATKLFGLQL